MSERPDDMLNGCSQEVADVERRLKSLEPSPAEFDASAILNAASAAGEAAIVPTPKHERLRPRSARWIALGASWACGAIAGALVTFVALSQPVAPIESHSRPSMAKTNNDVQATEALVVSDTGKDLPLWSRFELLVSTQLNELNRPATFEHPPLRAGSYASLTTASDSSGSRGTTDVDARYPNKPASSDRLPSDPLPPRSRGLDRDRLLRELLGDGSVL